MLFANDQTGNRIKASPGTRAVCQGCNRIVRAHCGEVLEWHWHHEKADCDPWHEPETAWHLNWKAKFPEDCCEVWESPHRADVRNGSGLVIEFQHSAIDAREIQEREAFWKNLIWVFDSREWFANLDLRLRPEKISFRWKHPRKSLFGAQCPIFLDTGAELFQITWLGQEVPCGGVGRFLPYSYFVRAMRRFKGHQK
jgi:competence CoiA-like predicted nuclease